MIYSDPQQISNVQYFQDKIQMLEERVNALEGLINDIYRCGGLTEAPIERYQALIQSIASDS